MVLLKVADSTTLLVAHIMLPEEDAMLHGTATVVTTVI